MKSPQQLTNQMQTQVNSRSPTQVSFSTPQNTPNKHDQYSSELNLYANSKNPEFVNNKNTSLRTLTNNQSSQSSFNYGQITNNSDNPQMNVSLNEDRIVFPTVSQNELLNNINSPVGGSHQYTEARKKAVKFSLDDSIVTGSTLRTGQDVVVSMETPPEDERQVEGKLLRLKSAYLLKLTGCHNLLIITILTFMPFSYKL
jgi:hypothetical protein